MFLDKDDWYIVYSAKLHGIVQALTIIIIRRQEISTEKIIINTNNQLSIRAVRDPDKRSSQIYIMQAIQLINILRSYNIAVELHWIPTHIEIKDNEWADKKAKKTTGWRSRVMHNKIVKRDTNETTQQSAIRYRMISTVRTVIKKHVYQQWTNEWKKETRDNALRRIQIILSNKIMQLYKFKRAKTSLITQIRIKKIDLKTFLHGRKVLEIISDKCECNTARQTIRYILQKCRLFSRQRRRL